MSKIRDAIVGSKGLTDSQKSFLRNEGFEWDEYNERYIFNETTDFDVSISAEITKYGSIYLTMYKDGEEIVNEYFSYTTEDFDNAYQQLIDTIKENS